MISAGWFWFLVFFAAFLNLVALVEFYSIKKYFMNLEDRDFLLSDLFILIFMIPMSPTFVLIGIMSCFIKLIGWIVDMFFDIFNIPLFKRK